MRSGPGKPAGGERSMHNSNQSSLDRLPEACGIFRRNRSACSLREHAAMGNAWGTRHDTPRTAHLAGNQSYDNQSTHRFLTRDPSLCKGRQQPQRSTPDAAPHVQASARIPPMPCRNCMRARCKYPYRRARRRSRLAVRRQKPTPPVEPSGPARRGCGPPSTRSQTASPLAGRRPGNAKRMDDRRPC